jgi:hypothetical protein
METIKPTSLTYLKDAELNLKREQEKNPNRAAAIALTHLQTAILWLQEAQRSN